MRNILPLLCNGLLAFKCLVILNDSCSFLPYNIISICGMYHTSFSIEINIFVHGIHTKHSEQGLHFTERKCTLHKQMHGLFPVFSVTSYTPQPRYNEETNYRDKEAKAHQLSNNSKLLRSQCNHISLWRRTLNEAVNHNRHYFCPSSSLHFSAICKIHLKHDD